MIRVRTAERVVMIPERRGERSEWAGVSPGVQMSRRPSGVARAVCGRPSGRA